LTTQSKPPKRKITKPITVVTPPEENKVTITIPLGAIPEHGYVSDRIDVTSLTYSQATALKQLVAGLDNRQAMLAGGRRIVNGEGQGGAPNAVRWMLEQIAEATGRA